MKKKKKGNNRTPIYNQMDSKYHVTVIEQLKHIYTRDFEGKWIPSGSKKPLLNAGLS